MIKVCVIHVSPHWCFFICVFSLVFFSFASLSSFSVFITYCSYSLFCFKSVHIRSLCANKYFLLIYLLTYLLTYLLNLLQTSAKSFSTLQSRLSVTQYGDYQWQYGRWCWWTSVLCWWLEICWCRRDVHRCFAWSTTVVRRPSDHSSVISATGSRSRGSFSAQREYKPTPGRSRIHRTHMLALYSSE